MARSWLVSVAMAVSAAAEKVIGVVVEAARMVVVAAGSVGVGSGAAEVAGVRPVVVGAVGIGDEVEVEVGAALEDVVEIELVVDVGSVVVGSPASCIVVCVVGGRAIRTAIGPAKKVAPTVNSSDVIATTTGF